MKNVFVTFFKGVIIGGTMTVPGISGGSMAMILGIYGKLISATNKAIKFDRKSIVFLTECFVGVMTGMVLFSNSLLMLLEKFPGAVRYFFIGTVVGGMPVIYRSAKVKGFDLTSLIYPLIGIILVTIISCIPDGIFVPADIMNVKNFFLQVIGGVIVAVALVLPGISVSQMLFMLGLYETVMTAIGSFDISPVIPLGIGIAIGIPLIAKFMDKAMINYPKATYLIIFGFVLGSLCELFPGIPERSDVLICVLSAVTGFFTLYFISVKTENLLCD